jgi:hypothetical protein
MAFTLSLNNTEFIVAGMLYSVLRYCLVFLIYPDQHIFIRAAHAVPYRNDSHYTPFDWPLPKKLYHMAHQKNNRVRTKKIRTGIQGAKSGREVAAPFLYRKSKWLKHRQWKAENIKK